MVMAFQAMPVARFKAKLMIRGALSGRSFQSLNRLKEHARELQGLRCGTFWRLILVANA